jgi:hypothetical protein
MEFRCIDDDLRRIAVRAAAQPTPLQACMCAYTDAYNTWFPTMKRIVPNIETFIAREFEVANEKLSKIDDARRRAYIAAGAYTRLMRFTRPLVLIVCMVDKPAGISLKSTRLAMLDDLITQHHTSFVLTSHGLNSDLVDLVMSMM